MVMFELVPGHCCLFAFCMFTIPIYMYVWYTHIILFSYELSRKENEKSGYETNPPRDSETSPYTTISSCNNSAQGIICSSSISSILNVNTY